MTLANLNNDTGVTTLIVYLSGLFARDELSKIYKCYIKFDCYIKEISIKIEDYVIEFEICPTEYNKRRWDGLH